ncbi:ATP-dependent RNA, partial [Chrysochromulina tobinii]
MEDDEAAFREAFGPARSSGIDFGDKAKDIPVEVELPRKLRNELPPEMAPVAHFDDLACGRVLRRNLGFAGFAQPTPVQSHSMPVALAGLDVISVAQTGSGKTLAFMLPILKRLLEQIAAESEKFAFRTGLRIGLAYGGTPFGSQMRELERGCDVLIGTPGRVNDMVSRERVSLRNVEVLVLDEADRMLDMGFEPQIRSLVEEADMPSSGREGGARSSQGRGRVEEEDGFGDNDDGDEAVGGGVSIGRQTLMFSATFPKAVRAIADSFLVDPLMLKVGRVGGAATSVTQRVIRVEGRDKTDKTAELLREVPGKTIVFVNTKREADNLEYDLNALGHPSASVHGDKDQRERERALGDFKAGRIEVIIGTDVLGRGIDVPEVTHVINYDAPDEIEDYTHRIGRTGRAGHLGIATTMITGANRNLARELTQMLAASKQEVPEWLADM